MTHSATAVVQALTVSCWNCCHRLTTGLVPPPLPPTSPTALPAHARHPPLPRRYPLILHPPQYDQSGLSKMQIWGQHPSTKNIPVAPHHIQDKGQAPEAGVLTPSWRDSIISYHNMNYTAGITLIIMYWIFKIFLNVSFLLEWSLTLSYFEPLWQSDEACRRILRIMFLNTLNKIHMIIKKINYKETVIKILTICGNMISYIYIHINICLLKS